MATNGKRKRTSYSIRCHPGLLKDLAKEARTNGRSKNAEIVRRLENSLVRKVG